MSECSCRPVKVIAFHVAGIPGAQGSKRHVGNGRLIESSRKVGPWRSDVHAAALRAIAAWQDQNAGGADAWQPFTGPVSVRACFDIARPQHHYGTGRHHWVLRPGAPDYVTSRGAGDLDKLLRSTFDALTAAGVWLDDSQVAQVEATKQYAVTSGLLISITPTPGGTE